MLARIFERKPMDLKGPNLTKAPIKTFHLSGSTLSFRCPLMTANIPGYFPGDTFDFDLHTKEEPGDPDNRFLRILSTGWSFFDRSWAGESYGGVCLSVILSKNNAVRDEEKSFFRCSNQIAHSIFLNEQKYRAQNELAVAKHEEELASGHLQYREDVSRKYPQAAEDVQVKQYNGTKWICYETVYPGRSPRIYCETALANNHMVRFSFQPSAYGGLDFYDCGHNLKEASYRLIEEVMSSVAIALSPQSQKQKEAVQNIYGPDSTL